MRGHPEDSLMERKRKKTPLYGVLLISDSLLAICCFL